MSKIKSLYGNPLHDSLAVHYTENASGDPIYPPKASNLIINPDGSTAYGSADGMIAVSDKSVIYTTAKWRETDGGVQNGYRMRTLQFIPVSAEKINDIANYVENYYANALRTVARSAEIGELVLDRLREIDPVSYIRFASVYIYEENEFKEKIKEVLD